jgi:hypothetical protein
MNRFAIILVGILALGPAYAVDDQRIAESARVKNSEILVRYAGSAGESRLTCDGTGKWSPSLETLGSGTWHLTLKERE